MRANDVEGIMTLTSRVANVERQVEAMGEDFTSTSAAVDSVQNEVDNLADIIKKMTSDVGQGNVDIACLKTGLATTDDVVGELQKNMEQMEDIITKVKDDISSNHAEVVNMLKKLESDHTSTERNDNAEANTTMTKMKAQIEEMQNQLNVWHSEPRRLAMTDVATDIPGTKTAPVEPNVNEDVISSKNTICRTYDDHQTTRETIKLSISDRIKIWQRKMSLNKVSGAGDFNFPAAKQDFLRLNSKFPMPDDLEREMAMLAFERAALKIANNVCRENSDSNSIALWDHLEAHLFNSTQQKAQNSTFLTMRWDEKTSP